MRAVYAQGRMIAMLVGVFVFFLLLPGITSAGTIGKPANNLGLLGYWSFDEGTGTQAGDFSGGDNNGFVTNATWTNGKFGNALDFDGSGDYVQAALSPDITGDDPRTISFWANVDSSEDVSGRQGWYIWQGPNSQGAGELYSIGVEGGYIEVAHWSDDRNYTDALVDFDNWQHVVVVYHGGGDERVYLNGELADSTNGSALVTTTGDWYVASRSGSTDYLHTKMDELRIYNRALAASEVQRLYQAGQVQVKSANKSGLVGYWSFDEGAGTQAGDFSGNDNTGTLAGSTLPSWVSGRFGNALSFDGSTSDINLSSSDPFSTLTSSFTITHWIKTSASSGQMYTVANAGGGSGFRFGLSSGKVAFLVGDAGGYKESACGSATVNDGEWHMITGVYSRSGTLQFTCYIDGVYQADVALTDSYDAMSTTAPGIGKPPCCVAFNGSLDEVRIYDRALSAAEIAGLYEVTATRANASQNSQLTDGLVGMWSFNGPDISGTTAYDRSGQGNNGTLSGATIPQPTIGKVGQALTFDGVSYINLSNPTSLQINEGTIVAWIRTSDAGSGYRGIVQKSQAYGLYLFNNEFGVYDDAASVWRGSGESLNDGDWHQVVAVLDSGVTNGTALYIDGSLVTSVTQTVDTQGASAFIGRGQGGASQVFNGVIDEVRVYNRKLSADEVSLLYQLGN